ncbi:hypothetical protein OAI84_00510 [bacterium]|nr:hypothetical protein [bacterium]
MYIFFLKEFKIPNSEKLSSFQKKDKQYILTQSGILIPEGKKLFQIKLAIQDFDVITKFISNFTLMYNKVIYKKINCFQIPFEHQILNRSEYTISSNLNFIIEETNNIKNFFFETTNDLDNFNLKKTLFSFLSTVK